MNLSGDSNPKTGIISTAIKANLKKVFLRQKIENLADFSETNKVIKLKNKKRFETSMYLLSVLNQIRQPIETNEIPILNVLLIIINAGPIRSKIFDRIEKPERFMGA